MPRASVEEVVKTDEASKERSRRRKKSTTKKNQNAPPFPPPSSLPLPRPRRLRHVFEPTPAMPSYLVAVVVGPLGEESSFVRGSRGRRRAASAAAAADGRCRGCWTRAPSPWLASEGSSAQSAAASLPPPARSNAYQRARAATRRSEERRRRRHRRRVAVGAVVVVVSSGKLKAKKKLTLTLFLRNHLSTKKTQQPQSPSLEGTSCPLPPAARFRCPRRGSCLQESRVSRRLLPPTPPSTPRPPPRAWTPGAKRPLLARLRLRPRPRLHQRQRNGP